MANLAYQSPLGSVKWVVTINDTPQDTLVWQHSWCLAKGYGNGDQRHPMSHSGSGRTFYLVLNLHTLICFNSITCSVRHHLYLLMFHQFCHGCHQSDPGSHCDYPYPLTPVPLLPYRYRTSHAADSSLILSQKTVEKQPCCTGPISVAWMEESATKHNKHKMNTREPNSWEKRDILALCHRWPAKPQSLKFWHIWI